MMIKAYYGEEQYRWIMNAIYSDCPRDIRKIWQASPIWMSASVPLDEGTLSQHYKANYFHMIARILLPAVITAKDISDHAIFKFKKELMRRDLREAAGRYLEDVYDLRVFKGFQTCPEESEYKKWSKLTAEKSECLKRMAEMEEFEDQDWGKDWRYVAQNVAVMSDRYVRDYPFSGPTDFFVDTDVLRAAAYEMANLTPEQMEDTFVVETMDPEELKYVMNETYLDVNERLYR
jgi:hypothetical protein